MKNLDKNVFDDSSQFGINNESKKFLKIIVFWSKFISIVGLLVYYWLFTSICINDFSKRNAFR